ncbi:Ankyrin repeat protein 1 [Giardia muris]|uniref:Ankyrin repeat protein 1 n=1 Tax=Giardia muris TaxID=5742 RepID=A0A4Z1SVU8_GIAMU|nr:Ankyrin repeat protein 1 [Giardia muris]|eukprot:TNJ29894.1 Ankyrin repeat protein 1 [Giardia muris]
MYLNARVGMRILSTHKKLLRTELMWAASAGDALKVQQFIHQAGKVDRSGWTALMLAADWGHIECVLPLLALEEGRASAKGSTALMLAAHSGRTECVYLLRDGEQGMADKHGITALMYAANRGHIECARLLTDEAGAQTTAESTWGEETLPVGVTALMLAARGGHREVVELLLPCELGLADSFGKTAYHYALNAGLDEIASMLVSEMEGWIDNRHRKTALMDAAEKGLPQLVKHYLHEQGQQDSDGWTALMYAGKNAHADCVRLLLEEASIRNAAGQTALDIVESVEPPDNDARVRYIECALIIQTHLFSRRRRLLGTSR